MYHCPTRVTGEGQRIRLDGSSGRLCTIVRRGSQGKDKGYASTVAADDSVPSSDVGHSGRTKNPLQRWQWTPRYQIDSTARNHDRNNNVHLATSARSICVFWIEGIPQLIVSLSYADTVYFTFTPDIQ